MSSFLNCLESGTLRWELLHPFPEQDSADRDIGATHVRAIGEFLAAEVDPELVDQNRALPDGLLDELQTAGYLRLHLDAEDGGLELSMYNTFRVIERAAAHSAAVGQVLGLANGAGAGALLPVLADGALRDFVHERVVAGTVSGWADTEPAGQNNRIPSTTAMPTADGSGYLLRGEKVFTGNGPIADLLVVTATVPAGQQPEVCLFFVDTASPGFQVRSELEYMGSNGLPSAALKFDDVFVPQERVLRSGGGDIRQSPLITAAGLLGRLYIAAAPALGIARCCLGWQRDFVTRRAIDGRGLGEYDRIQRGVARTAADFYAMDSFIRWCLLDCGLAERWFERLAAKNIVTMTAWRVVDRTMSLLAGEGFETARSKRRRNVPAIPLERAFRDARGFRIAGNVDFQLDYQLARLLLARYYDGAAGRAGVAGDPETADARDADLSPANLAHLQEAAEQTRQVARTCLELTSQYSDPAALFADEQTLVLLGRIVSELLTMSAALARASRPAPHGAPDTQLLADVYCTEARHRLADHWRRFTPTAEPDYAKISRAWLADAELDLLAAS
jgi:alkylation response protein AidB-like acyl-CoA dehydrogenase